MRYRGICMLAVVAWAAVTACLLWLPSHWLMAPPGAMYHTERLLGSILLAGGALVCGWRGFCWICRHFAAGE